MRRFRKDFSQYPLAVFLTYWGHDNKKFHNGDPDRFPLTETDKKVLKSLKENNVSIKGYIQCTPVDCIASPIFLCWNLSVQRRLIQADEISFSFSDFFFDFCSCFALGGVKNMESDGIVPSVSLGKNLVFVLFWITH